MRGITKAFEESGLKFKRIDISPPYTYGDYDQRDVRKFSLGELPEGCDPGIVFVMKPNFSILPLIEQGCKLVGFHVGDVSEVPEAWVKIMEKEELVVTPSQWMKSVIERDVETEVLVANHGVSDFYLTSDLIDEEPVPGPIKFLHFCSSPVYPERKGTPQALEAFLSLRQRGINALMTLVVPEKKLPIKKLLGKIYGYRDDVLVQCRPYGFPEEEMIKLLREHHALLCPSRAEGYGLQSIESRCLGLPVVQTFCTGMLDHPPGDESVGVVPVPHGSLTKAWGDYGKAPEVLSKAVEEALVNCVKSYESLRQAARGNAQAVRDVSSWSVNTKGLIKRLKEMVE
jgi:glycosyltransferase involved in cell wall biosynthesis